eukprot:1222922-Prymnesium_polylepis.1
MRPGGLGAGRPRLAQSARFVGARRCRICTAGRAVVAVASAFAVDCEPYRAGRGSTEDPKCVVATWVVGSPNCIIDGVWLR